MGVADNRTYKQEYHFTDTYNGAIGTPEEVAKRHTSIKTEPKVNTTIKENPYRSNVEIEGDEIVLKPDLSALFKAVGKSHKQGGVDVLLQPDSFVFSDYEGLKVTPKEKNIFELKEGGKTSTDTPADVLKKNVDIKHYNTLISILKDPFKDDLAKTSAAKMLDKYLSTIGNVAYIQESKKGFPQGVPDFAMGTAPVYDTDLKDKIMENKQYAKAGGKISAYRPTMQLGGIARAIQYLNSKKQKQDEIPTITLDDIDVYGAPKTTPLPSTSSWGLWQGDKLPVFRNRFGVSNAADKINNLDNLSSQLGYTGPKNNKAFQQWLYNSSPENAAVIDKWHSTYEDPSIAVSMDKRNRFDGKIGIRWANAINEILNRPKAPRANITITNPGTEEWPSASAPLPVPGTVVGEGQGPKKAAWNFTPWQKASHLYDMFQWLNVDKYGANRSHYDATYVDPALVNPEQAVGDAKSLANQQITGANVLNPILRNAQAASAYGQYLDKIPGIRTQYDNQNANIVNQFRQYNNQIRNNESLLNMQNDKDYFRDATTAEVNFKNMRTYLANQAMSNLMKDVGTNQKLAYSLLQQNNPVYGFDWNTGNFTRNPVNILDVPTGDAKSDMYTELAQTIMGKIRAGKNPTPEEVAFMKSLAVGKLNFSASDTPTFKKGGRNPYK